MQIKITAKRVFLAFLSVGASASGVEGRGFESRRVYHFFA